MQLRNTAQVSPQRPYGNLECAASLKQKAIQGTRSKSHLLGLVDGQDGGFLARYSGTVWGGPDRREILLRELTIRLSQRCVVSETDGLRDTEDTPAILC